MNKDHQAQLDAYDVDIQEAYLLMDEVARAEGWGDAEMATYDIYARRHPLATTTPRSLEK